MCVLCYKPQGIKKPTIDILTACYKANPHGCGLATSEGRLVKTTNFEHFVKEFYKVSDKVAMLFHFRFATHGSVKKTNCHPFKADNVFFAHNGVLSDIITKNDKTDSETAFLEYFLPALRQSDYNLEAPYFQYVVNQFLGGNKFAFMIGDKVQLFGDYSQIEGVYYSNLRWRYYSTFRADEYWFL